ncbi:MAG TPA: hypothetical protein VFB80_09255 [Pirellulaceae bacterium]|nr:hypothetical protein [Pirellulaceae bacterium]
MSELPYPDRVPDPNNEELPADPWNPLVVSRGGSPVAVRWSQGLWLHAVALAGNDQHCSILLADGRTTQLPRASVVAIPTRPVFQVGHEVMARWRNAAMFPGTLTSIGDMGHTVAWHDGDVPMPVPLGSLTFLEWCQTTEPAVGPPPGSAAKLELKPPVVPVPEIVPGAWVAIRGRNGYWIASVEAAVDGGFNVRFTDGARATVPDSDVFPMPEGNVFEVGDEVLALWKGGSLYPGTITEESHEGYTVAWHDGDMPLVVKPGTLTYLFWVLEGTQ